MASRKSSSSAPAKSSSSRTSLGSFFRCKSSLKKGIHIQGEPQPGNIDMMNTDLQFDEQESDDDGEIQESPA